MARPCGGKEGGEQSEKEGINEGVKGWEEKGEVRDVYAAAVKDRIDVTETEKEWGS